MGVGVQGGKYLVCQGDIPSTWGNQDQEKEAEILY